MSETEILKLYKNPGQQMKLTAEEATEVDFFTPAKIAKRKGKKIVLFSPKPVEYEFSTGPPAALMLLTPYIKDYDIVIISATDQYDYTKRMLNEAKDALFIGISCMTGYQVTDGLKVAKELKKKYPDLPLVWGGWHPTVLPEQTIENPYVDIMIKGQGDKAILEIADTLNEGTQLDKIKGIYFRKNGKIIKGEDRKFENATTTPPIPDHILKEEHIFSVEFAKRAFYYLTSIGCPYACTFCAELYMSKRRWYGLKSDRVVDEIEHLVKRFNLDGIVFNDQNFIVDKERVRRICQGFIDKKLNIKWSFAGRIDQLLTLSDDIWAIMKKAGLYQILVGAESGKQEYLDLIGKNIKIEDTYKLAEVCKKYDILVKFSLMLSFPTKDPKEVDKEFVDVVKMIRNMLKVNDKNRFSLFLYTPYPGTPLYFDAIKYGFKEPKKFEEWGAYNMFNLNTPWTPKKYNRVIKHINLITFAYAGSYRKTNTKGAMAYKLLHAISMYRLNHAYFGFPIDYYLYNFAKSSLYKFGRIKSRFSRKK